MKAKQGGNFKPVVLPEPQSTVARCYSMVHIGTIPNFYEGKLTGNVNKVFITWELPKLKAVFREEKGPEPFVISEEMTLSTNENSNLAKLISTWRGTPFTAAESQEFDPSVMVGKTALVQLTHKTKLKFKGQDLDAITNENTNLKMLGIMRRPKDMEIPAQINPTMIWDWDAIEDGTDEFDKEKWEKIPKFLREKMRDSEEYKRLAPSGLDSEEAPVEKAPEAKADEKVADGDDW